MGGVIVSYAMCWACTMGQHFAEPTWHTYADEDDVLHAEMTGQDNPSEIRCHCYCADEPVKR